jgi:glycosyltransferase involved in cell wall biosynthesis
MSKLPITVLITTFNEAQHMEALLQNVSNWAAEILVIDSFSTDNTIAIIQQFEQIRCLQRKYIGPADQKNWAIPQATYSTVLLMDADERLTPALKLEIEAILVTNSFNNYDVYRIGFQHFFMGKRVQYSGWQNDTAVRLIQRDKARYNQNQVHEEIDTTHLKVGLLKYKFEHYTYRDLDTFLKKQMRYAAWSAQDYAPKTGQITVWHLWVKPFFRFFKHYVLKLGFLDGKVGLVISAIMAWGVFLRYVHIAEMRRNHLH